MDEFVPNWKAIETSVVWREQIKPMLDAMYQDALEDKATTRGVGAGDANATLDNYHFWRGYCAAIKTVNQMPAAMVELNRQEKEQEAKDELLRQQTRRARA